MGIDAGGLFKEFLTKLTEKIFDPQFALFVETEIDRKQYPNVLSAYEDPENYRQYYNFIGMIVGKALYEGVLLKCRFARFFLNKIVDKSNQVDDLKAIDQQFYDNLMQVKYYEDSPVEDLGLTMTVAQDIFGESQEIQLLPNGANVPVTNENRLVYIILYANWLLNGRIREQVSNFVRGMRSVFSEEYFSIFFPDEIDNLISGGKNEIDIDDLQKHTKY